MDEQSAFDRLVQTLSREERKGLLEKLQSEDGAVLSPAPLNASIDSSPANLKKAYEQLTFLERLFLFLRVMFTSESREDALEHLILTKMAKRIEREHPNAYDYRGNHLLTSFQAYLQELKYSLAFLHEPFSKAFGSKKQDFFAFMVGRRFPEIEDRLLKEIEPEQVAYEKSLDDPKLVKKEIEFRLEDIIEGIGQEQRELLYRDARRFNTLYHLVFFHFEKILSRFVYNEEKKRYQVPLGEVRDPLNEMAQILSTLQEPPSEGMLKILFVFHLQKELESEDSEEINTHLNELLRQAEKAMNSIRQFNQRVPLLDLIRLVRRNLDYVPPEIGGGEDWFVLFKQFWYRRFDTKIKAYIREEKRKKLQDEATEFLKSDEFPQILNYNESFWSEAGVPRYARALGFVRGFTEEHFFGEMHGPIKLILIDGEFYKEQNRDEYNDAYNGMLKINDEILALENDLTEEGEIRKKMERIQSETLSFRQREQKMRKLLSDTDRRVEQMISKSIECLTIIKNVIDGILYGDVGGRYDTLSNLGYIGRNENKNLSNKLNSIKTKIDSFLNILTRLFDTERQL